MIARPRSLLTRRTLIGAALAAPAILRPRSALAQSSRGRFSSTQYLSPSGPPRIDWSHPLAYGLVGAYVPGRASKTICDLTGLGANLVSGSGLSFKPTQEGFSADTSSGQAFAIASPAQQPASTASVFWRGALNASPTATGILTGVAFNDSSASPFIAFDLETSAAGAITSDVGTTTGGIFTGTWASPPVAT